MCTQPQPHAPGGQDGYAGRGRETSGPGEAPDAEVQDAGTATDDEYEPL